MELKSKAQNGKNEREQKANNEQLTINRQYFAEAFTKRQRRILTNSAYRNKLLLICIFWGG